MNIRVLRQICLNPKDTSWPISVPIAAVCLMTSSWTSPMSNRALSFGRSEFLGNLWINEKGDIYDKKHGLWDCPYSKFHVTQALNCFLLTIEMFILSFAFAFSFPSSEFKIPIDATGFMLDDEDGGDVTVLPRN